MFLPPSFLPQKGGSWHEIPGNPLAKSALHAYRGTPLNARSGDVVYQIL